VSFSPSQSRPSRLLADSDTGFGSSTRRAGNLYGETRTQCEVGGFILTQGVYPPALKIGRHDHELASICVVLAGSYDETFGRRSRRAEPGTVIVHPEGEHHAESHDLVEVKLLTVEIAAEQLGQLRPAIRAFNEAWHRKDDRFVAFASRMLLEAGCSDQVSGLALESLMLELLAAMDRIRLAETCGSPWLLRVRDRLHDDGETPTMKQLSELAGVHPVHLARAFRRAFGCSVGEYMRRQQVGRAMALLSAGKLSLAAVAFEAGFADQSHMTRLIHAETGLTPGEWRRRFSR
jgi:AraC family transcriptional regulator